MRNRKCCEFRPLTYLDENNFDEPLTPYPLIFGRNIVNVNDATLATDLTEHNAKLCTERIQVLLQHFKKRFYHEYLAIFINVSYTKVINITTTVRQRLKT